MAEPLTDAEMAQMRADLIDKLHLITEKERELRELQEEAADLAADINTEEQRRKHGHHCPERFRVNGGPDHGVPDDERRPAAESVVGRTVMKA